MEERAFTYDISDDPRRLALHGDLDEGTTLQLRSLLNDLTYGLTQDLTVDLTDVDLLPSSAIGVIANAQDTARRQDATLSLVAAEGTISARVLTICGLTYETA